jgi:predicted Zn-dependent protease
LDIHDERRLGERIMRELRRDPDFLDDPLLTDYIHHLFDPLVEAARARGDIAPEADRAYAWDTFQVRDRAVNAFALPGGYIGVYLGLIGLTASAEELASVLAHELTHVTQRHIARGMVNSQRQGTAALAAALLGLVLASRAGNAGIDVAQAAVMGSQAAAVQGQLNFSREMEREADRIGLQLLGQAGFGTAGMAAMFEKLDGHSRLNDSNAFPYLRTHPLTIERISEARLRMGDVPSGRRISAAQHALMQARARALMDREVGALRRLQSAGAPGSPLVDATRLGQLYGAALASTALREFDSAQASLQAAQRLAAQQFGREAEVQQVLALATAELALAQTPAAGQLPALLAPWATDRSRPARLLRLNLAAAAWRSGDASAGPVLRQAVEDLQTWLAENRRDALAWQTLATGCEALGLKLRGLRAAAEATAARGDVMGAVDRFRVAQQAARQDPAADYAETAVIQSRLRELEAEKRRLIEEVYGGRPPPE